MQEHFKDPYVQAAHKSGYRSRGSFKLLEIDAGDKLLASGMSVIDLGAAPGGWSQVAAEKVGDRGRVIASDILPMDALEGVTFIQGDFTENFVYHNIVEALGETKANLVISDMAPNISGIRSSDQMRAMYLAELALDLACQVLQPGSSFLVKVFQGEGFVEYLQNMRNIFARVISRKPASSRSRSREMYLLGRCFKGQAIAK